MRIRRSVTRFFGALVIPSICAAGAAYFGYYAIWGSRGALALTDVQARLGVRQDELAALKDQRRHLQHRIKLLEPGTVDSDMVEELARGQLQDGEANQVAVPRDGH